MHRRSGTAVRTIPALTADGFLQDRPAGNDGASPQKKPPTKDGFFRLAAYGRDGKINAGATVIRWWAVQGSNL
jgi:hypothetical protein